MATSTPPSAQSAGHPCRVRSLRVEVRSTLAQGVENEYSVRELLMWKLPESLIFIVVMPELKLIMMFNAIQLRILA